MAQVRLLIVDDEEELIIALAERLEIRGFAPVTAVTGEQALGLVREREFDLVLLDIKMPGVDGLEVMRRMKRERPGLPVILLTGHLSKRTNVAGMNAGADEYLLKPIDIDDLLTKISGVLENRRRMGGS